MTRRPETDIARPVVAWLQAQGWTVYQEVQHQGCVADIVAVRGPLLWVIECKAQLGLAVLGQALGWQGHAHAISVAVMSDPKPKDKLKKPRLSPAWPKEELHYRMHACVSLLYVYELLTDTELDRIRMRIRRAEETGEFHE
jgi:hypothetical protein